MALLLFGLLLISPAAFAQVEVKRSTETTRIGSKEYYMHHVTQGQTLYSISVAYNVTVENQRLSLRSNPKLNLRLNPKWNQRLNPNLPLCLKRSLRRLWWSPPPGR